MAKPPPHQTKLVSGELSADYLDNTDSTVDSIETEKTLENVSNV